MRRACGVSDTGQVAAIRILLSDWIMIDATVVSPSALGVSSHAPDVPKVESDDPSALNLTAQGLSFVPAPAEHEPTATILPLATS
jgi:hypothetical protein